MSQQVSELERVLEQLIGEHRRLLEMVEKHQAAMKTIDLPAMDDLGRQQEAARLRITSLEQRRRALVIQLAKSLDQPGEMTLGTLAALYPANAANLLRLRRELKAVLEQVAAKTRISAKVSSAVLGHLNTVVRLLAGAVERAGLYTKDGIPKVSSRIGVMEAVG
jgi:hypothetical protein